MTTFVNTFTVPSNPNNVIEIKLANPLIFKQIFSAIKDQVRESLIKIDKEKLSLSQKDLADSVAIKLTLYAENFEAYYCQEPLCIGIDVVNFAKILKCLSNKDILTLYVENVHVMGNIEQRFCLRVDDSKANETTKYIIQTIDINDDIDFDISTSNKLAIQMETSSLHTIITKLKTAQDSKSQKSDYVNIIYTNSILCFSTNNIELKKKNIVVLNQKQSNLIFNINVNIQKLIELCKCSQISKMVTIYLENNAPLTLEYNVGNLGKLYIKIAPRISDTHDDDVSDNDNYDDDDSISEND